MKVKWNVFRTFHLLNRLWADLRVNDFYPYLQCIEEQLSRTKSKTFSWVKVGKGGIRDISNSVNNKNK